MNIAKSISLRMPVLGHPWQTCLDWMGLCLFDFLSWKFGLDNTPPSIIRYPSPRPDPVNLQWPKDAEAEEALRVLRREFSRFSVYGLMCLGREISRGFIPGTDWSDSILSFRLGFRGSAIMDTEGKKENPFTIYWRDHWREINLEWLLFEIRAKL